MSVIKRKRNESQFEVFHHFYKVRKEMTDLLLKDFGFSESKSNLYLSKLLGNRTLDDYEEGSFTPVVTFGGSSAGITYTRQVGRYTRIGRVIIIDIDVILSNKGTATGSALIDGLPFAKPASVPYESLSSEFTFINVPSDAISVHANTNGGTKLAFPRFTRTSSIIGGDNTHFTNSTSFRISGCYTI